MLELKNVTKEIGENKAKELSIFVKQCLISRYDVDNISVEDIQDTGEFDENKAKELSIFVKQCLI